MITTSEQYSVEESNGVTIIRADSVGLTTWASLVKGFSKTAVLDIGLANRIGAHTVIGSPTALQAYRASNPPACALVQRQLAEAALAFKGERLAQIFSYLDGYQRGASADALLAATAGLDCARNKLAIPHDNSDLARCARLYKNCAVVRQNFEKVRKVSSDWNIAATQLLEFACVF